MVRLWTSWDIHRVERWTLIQHTVAQRKRLPLVLWVGFFEAKEQDSTYHISRFQSHGTSQCGHLNPIFFGEWRYLPNWLAPHTGPGEVQGIREVGWKPQGQVWSLVDKSRYPADYQNSLLNMVTAPVELRCFRRFWKHHGCNLQTDLSTLHLLSAAPCSNFLLVLCTEFVQLIPLGILGQYLES